MPPRLKPPAEPDPALVRFDGPVERRARAVERSRAALDARRVVDIEPLWAILARVAANPPAATRVATRSYVGRANVEPPPLGVVGDIDAALREIPDRKSRLRGP